MDEPLKRRLIGTCALLLLALLISFVLPSPGTTRDADGLKQVTLDLRQPPGSEAPAPGPVASPVPPVIAAPLPKTANDATNDTAPEDDAAPQFDQPAGSDSVADSSGIPAQQPQSQPLQKPQVTTAKPAPPSSPAAVAAVKSPAVKPPPPPPAPEVAAHSGPQQGHWFIQAGVFSDIDNARHQAARLKAGGYAAIISPTETHAGVAYRVKAGPYGSREQADLAQQGLPKVGIVHSMILNP